MPALDKARSILVSGGRAVLVAVMLFALWPVDVAQSVQGACTTNRVKFRTATNEVSENSGTFTNIPQSSVNVTVGGAAPTCVIVVFSAEVQTSLTLGLLVRARLTGGIGIGEPPHALFYVGDPLARQTRSMQFVFENVPPGSYTVRMQFRAVVVDEGPGDASLIRRTLVVHHR